MLFYPYYDQYYAPFDNYEREQQEYTRRRRAAEQAYALKLVRQRALEEELLRQRHQEQEEEYRRQLLEMEEAKRLKQGQRRKNNVNHPLYLGPGGCLYRVPVHNQDDDDDSNQENHVLNNNNTINKKVVVAKTPPVGKESTDIPPTKFKRKQTNKKKPIICNKSEPKQRNTTMPKENENEKPRIIVEDASDSEYEEDERSTSIWRNRRPSPGLLMEPVETIV
jgi:hypothetical protein